jgi:uncharacterized protein
MKAIDTHVHFYTGQNATMRRAAVADGLKAFKSSHSFMNADQIADYYRQRDMMAVIFDVDTETTSGVAISNDDIADAMRAHPDVITGFGSVDPHKGPRAVEEAERCIKDLGLRGMKFQQCTQHFYPHDEKFYPLWEKIQELGVPMIFHCGTTAIGNGAPGGRGIKLDYARPIPYMDQVAADFPNLTIIAAHPGFPWHDEQLSMVKHKGNVWMDLSGWSPKYFPATVVQYVNTLIQDKVLFGSDFPMLTPDRWLEDFDKLPIKPEVRQKVLLDNAKRLFNLA